MVNFQPSQLFSTYSIVARDPKTGQLGGAVQTHQMSVGRIVLWGLPGIGMVATQSLVNISFGPMALAMLKEKVEAPNVVKALVASDSNAKRRQIGIVDAQGNSEAFTGDGCIPEAQHFVGDGYTVQANMMTNKTVIPAMREAFETTTGDLADRMLSALQAAQAEDGDIRGMQSAAMKIIPGDINAHSWAHDFDLRVDEHENPVDELARLVRFRQAQLLDAEGHSFFQDNNFEGALEKWQKAREKAPELEEVAFWQAITLADKKPQADSVTIAAEILKNSVQNDVRWEQWIELIRRLKTCGLIEREGAGEELLGLL